MEAFEVKFRDWNHIGLQTAYAFAKNASCAIKKVCKKFKVSEQNIEACTHLGRKIVF